MFKKGHPFYKGGEKGWFKKGQLQLERRTGRFKKCDWKECNVQIWITPAKEKKGYGKYHNRICRGLAERGIIWSTKGLFKKDHIPHNKGEFGELNPRWKGDNIQYASLHGRMKRRIPKSKNCQKCGKETEKLDLSNISYKYLSKILDWEWLCRGCHNKKDWRNGDKAAKVFETTKRNGKNMYGYKKLT